MKYLKNLRIPKLEAIASIKKRRRDDFTQWIGKLMLPSGSGVIFTLNHDPKTMKSMAKISFLDLEELVSPYQFQLEMDEFLNFFQIQQKLIESMGLEKFN